MTPALLDLPTLIEDAQRLEPLPASAVRLSALAAGESPDLDGIVAVVRLDEALTARLLSAANSVLSGTREEIDTVERAVLRLGPPMVLALAIGPAVREAMARPLEAYGLAEGELWRHSVGCALAVERARSWCSRPAPSHAFPCALLHDVGKLVLARHLSPHLRARLDRACRERGLSPDEAEIEVLHVCHGRLGALVCDAWRLPPKIAAAVRYHHRPLSAHDEEGRHVGNLIALGEAACAEVAGCSHSTPHRFDGALAGSLGITRAGFEALRAEVAEALEEVLALYAG